MGSNSVPLFLKIGECAAILKTGVGEIRTLVKGKELDAVAGPGGYLKIFTASVINFLGRQEFKRRWPSGMGTVVFEQKENRSR